MHKKYPVMLSEAERNNLAGERSAQELKKRRSELIAWRAQVRSMYDPAAAEK